MKTPFARLTAFSLLALTTAACQKTEYIHVGPNWAAAQKMSASSDAIQVKVVGPDAAEMGDVLAYTVTSNERGHLWVLEVDPEDVATVISEHEVAGNPQRYFEIEANEPLSLPKFRASEPAGKSMVVFIVTDPDTSLDTVLDGTSAEPTGVMPKALTLLEKTPEWGLAKKVVAVTGETKK